MIQGLNMHFFKNIFLTLALCSAAMIVTTNAANAAEPKNGVDYLTLATPQNTDSGKKIEVTEFFAYYCPHCDAFEPALEAWVKKQGDHIAFKRVHVPYDERVLPQQRLFFTLEALGLTEQYHQKIFHAMHVDHLRLNSDELVFDFMEKQGIERKNFIAAYTSFGVAARLRRADAMLQAYTINSWPTVAIDGRFLTSPSQAGQSLGDVHSDAELHAAALKVMDFLVARAEKH